MDNDKPKSRKKKPGQWSPLDILFGLFGIAAVIALTVAAFKVARWAIATYL
jgi:hypothetical protein